jgi:hypothetical protein
MNKRLQELEKQSIITIETREISGAWDNDRPPYRYVTTTETKFSPEKFAELIVRECLGIVHQEHKNALEFNWDNDDTAQTIRDSISEHFGVEE